MAEGEGPNLDLNMDPPIVFEQNIKQENNIFNIFLKREEMVEIIRRLPKKELQKNRELPVDSRQRSF